MSEEKKGAIDVNPPAVLWLQWLGEGEADEFATEAPSEVTWCKDKIFKNDVQYVIADTELRSAQLRAAFQAGRGSRRSGGVVLYRSSLGYERESRSVKTIAPSSAIKGVG